MQTIYKMLSSKTVWTIATMFVIGGFQSIQGLVPAGSLSWILGALGALAVYFKMNPSQSY